MGSSIGAAALVGIGARGVRGGTAIGRTLAKAVGAAQFRTFKSWARKCKPNDCTFSAEDSYFEAASAQKRASK